MSPRHKVLDTLTVRLEPTPQLQVLDPVVELVTVPVVDALVRTQNTHP